MEQSPQRAREGKETLDGIENSLKVTIGRMKALDDPAFMATLSRAEAQLKARTRGKAGIGDPWADVAHSMNAYRSFYIARRFAQPSGGNNNIRAYGVILRWHPFAAAEVTGVFGGFYGRDEDPVPNFFPAGDALPPQISRGQNLGQDSRTGRHYPGIDTPTVMARRSG